MKSTRSCINNIALLIIWSAMFLFSCDEAVPKDNTISGTTPTMAVDSLVLKYSEDGHLSYMFTTDRLERYQTIDSSYMMFPKGVVVETFNDSTAVVESSLSGDDGFFNETTTLWRVRGHVVGRSKDGKELFTEELYWDQKNKKIYSFVKSVIVDGQERLIGNNGFEADEEMTNIVFKKSVGRIMIDTTKNSTDSLSQDIPLQKDQPAATPAEQNAV